MAHSPLSRRNLLLLALSAFALILSFSPVAVADAGKEDVSSSSPSLPPGRSHSPTESETTRPRCVVKVLTACSLLFPLPSRDYVLSPNALLDVVR